MSEAAWLALTAGWALAGALGGYMLGVQRGTQRAIDAVNKYFADVKVVSLSQLSSLAKTEGMKH